MEQKIQKIQEEHKNLKVVDRSTIQEVLSELKLSMAISSGDRIAMGKMTGAAHYFTCEFSRTFTVNPWGYIHYDLYSYRLLYIQTGEVLASQSMTKRYRA